MTDWSRSSSWRCRPASIALPYSNRVNTNKSTSDCNTDLVTDRRMQLVTVLATWDHIETSESRYMPRSRTEWTGVIMAVQTETGATGICDFHNEMMNTNTSILAAFSSSWLAGIHDAKSSTHSSRRHCNSTVAFGLQKRISVCRWRNYVAVDRGFLSVVIRLPCTKETRLEQVLILVAPHTVTCKSRPLCSTTNNLSATIEVLYCRRLD